jgi:hypothetical protein
MPDVELNARYSTLKFPECQHGTSPVYVNTIQTYIQMIGLIEYLSRIEYAWRYRCVDTCLHNKVSKVCISLLTGRMTQANMPYD